MYLSVASAHQAQVAVQVHRFVRLMREIRVALAFKTAEAYPEPACQAVVFKLQARAVQAAAPGRPFDRCRGGEMRLCGFAQNEFPEHNVAALA